MKRHSTDLTSLIFGIVFLTLAAWWLASQYVRLSIPHLGWFLAGGLIIVGALGIVASLRGEKAPAPQPTAIDATEEPADEARL